MTKLKPCPFCGGEATVDYSIMDYSCWGVVCTECCAYIDTVLCEDDTPEKAIEKWNRRVSDGNG